jgi:hypothetical protein
LDVLNWGDLSVPREIEDLGYFLLGTRVGIWEFLAFVDNDVGYF